MREYPKAWWLILLFLFLVFKAMMMGSMISGLIKGNVVEATNLDEDRVDVNGLNVTMSGFTESEAGRAEAKEAARTVNDDIAGPVDVETLFFDGESTPEPETQAPDSTQADLKPSAVTVVASPDGKVVLSGTIPDEGTRSALVGAAKTEFGQEVELVDELVVDSDGFTNDGGQLVVSGEVGSEAEKTDRVDQATAVAKAGNLELVDKVTVVQIDDALNSLFELEPIEFDTARSTIRPGSKATLDTAAELLNENPDAGRLKAIGHTDSDGETSANQKLSDSRASAVVAYLVETGGVPADRLEGEGQGESELKVSP